MAVVTGKPGGPFPSVPDAQGYPYTERIRPPKYNREMKLSSLDASNQRRYAPRYFTDWDQDDHLYAAVQQLERAAKLEEKHFHTAMKAVERYGGQGALIAGGLRDHWPESVKQPIREAAWAASAAMDAAHFHYAATSKRKPFRAWREEIGAMW